MRKFFAIAAAILLFTATVSSTQFATVYAVPDFDPKEKKNDDKNNKKTPEIRMLGKKMEGTIDADNDGTDDVYIKIKNVAKAIKVDFKVRDDCVDGTTYEDAEMKLGLSNIVRFPVNNFDKVVWLTDEVDAKNKWFEKNDPNKRIDTFVPSSTSELTFDFPVSGDNIIQKNLDEKKNSVKHKDAIQKIGGQSGWEGSFTLEGPPGDHLLWLRFPGGDPVPPVKCEFLAAATLEITIRS